MKSSLFSLLFSLSGLAALLPTSQALAEGQPGTAPAPTPPGVTAVYTSFKPNVYSFQFVNSFENVVNLPVGIKMYTSGLCGGMSYAAADYYWATKAMPKQDYRPADGTVLHSYIHKRQVDSLISNADKWTEVILNPFGWRNSEFFKWGLQGFNGGRIEELRSLIDNGKPALLGLKGANGTGDHQVLAFGYDLGRYKGDLGAYQEDFKIFVLDPNLPGRTRVLKPDLSREVYYMEDNSSINYQTYFVDKNYKAVTPPTIPEDNFPQDGKIYKVIIEIPTGNDDLRGDQDNVNVRVGLVDGRSFSFSNVNNYRSWVPNYSQTVELPLNQGINYDDIYSVHISTTFGGGVGGDNWDMGQAKVKAVSYYGPRFVGYVGAHRFTGDSREKSAVFPKPNMISSLQLIIATEDDDLRGGNDNINVSVNFRTLPTQTFTNVNHGARYADRTTNAVTINLTRPIPLSELSSLTLNTASGGGVSGDNWNMRSIRIDTLGSTTKTVGTYGAKRFTGDSRFLNITLTP